MPPSDCLPGAWHLYLPPCLPYADGWSGTVNEFLLQIADGTLPLAQIPLASVVDQYLAHIKILPLDEAGEWIHTAAYLIHQKSRLLLPLDPAFRDTAIDPREEIVRELTAAQRAHHTPKPSLPGVFESERPKALSLLDLFVLLNEVEQRLTRDATYFVSPLIVTLSSQLQWLQKWVTEQAGLTESADLLFERQPSREARIFLFLALLEFEKQGHIRLTQETEFGPITLQRIKA